MATLREKRACFTNEEPFIVTEYDVTTFNPAQFRCFLCGHHFKEGDTCRWVYSSATSGSLGNILVCPKCDGADVVARWVTACREAQTKYWWLKDFSNGGT